MTQEAELKFINLKDVHLPMKTTRAERLAVRQKVEAAGLTLMGGGVIYLTTPEADFRGAFEYVKDAGMPLMVTSIAPALLDTLEKWVKEYDVRVAINNRGPGQANFSSPYDIFRAVKSRDARLGICMDTGHTARLGEDPAKAIRDCRSRLFDLHLKDVTLAKPEGKSTAIGFGAIDMVAVFKELLRQKFPYHVGIECDEKEDAPQPDVLASVAYIRGVLAAI
jgi:sugar phosphate isomerase/epimerase